jgi:glycosyltransferase involved in cell wall biosynthesis
MQSAVSVIVRVFNAERYLREAVQSVLAQSFADFELLAIDDGSTDSSVAILEAFGDPRIRVVSQPNGGKIAAAERGLNEARGRYVAILDADDRCAPERLAQQVAYLDAHAETVMIGSALGIIDERGARIGVRRYPQGDAALRRAVTIYNPFGHSSLMYRRDVALAAGGYDPRYVIEDWDLSLRLMRRGEVANLPGVLAEYRVRTDAVDARLIKVVLRGTIAARALAHNAYGFPRTARSLAVDVAQRALCFAPASLANWLCFSVFYRHS